MENSHHFYPISTCSPSSKTAQALEQVLLVDVNPRYDASFPSRTPAGTDARIDRNLNPGGW